MSTETRLDRAAIEALARDAMMRPVVREAAENVAEKARSSSPYLTGHYRASITVGEPRVDGAAMTCSVGSRDMGSVAIEFGSIHNAPFAPITKGVRASGLRLEAGQ